MLKDFFFALWTCTTGVHTKVVTKCKLFQSWIALDKTRNWVGLKKETITCECDVLLNTRLRCLIICPPPTHTHAHTHTVLCKFHGQLVVLRSVSIVIWIYIWIDKWIFKKRWIIIVNKIWRLIGHGRHYLMFFT